MKRRFKRSSIEVFSLSFLDIISCAFGAIVMLVLLAKNGDLETSSNSSDANLVSELLDQLLQAQQSSANLEGALSVKQQQLSSAQAETAALQRQLKQLEQKVPKATEALNKLDKQAQTIREDIRQTNALLNTPATTKVPDKDVGGVPTDADYVVFVIDNSGSMVNIGWNKIIEVVADVIENHPKLKGFNVMAADGRFLPIKTGGWIRDSKINRRKVMAELKGFKGGASQPEVGILKSIKQYKKTKGKVSIYVFGDEYTQVDLKGKVAAISRANRNPITKKPRFRIHGIGFYLRGSTPSRQGFAAFMKSVAFNNRGAFIALSTQ